MTSEKPENRPYDAAMRRERSAEAHTPRPGEGIRDRPLPPGAYYSNSGEFLEISGYFLKLFWRLLKGVLRLLLLPIRILRRRSSRKDAAQESVVEYKKFGE